MVVKYVNLPLQNMKMEKDILSAITRVVRSGNYILGQEVGLFEKDMARYMRSKYAIGVANGTDALTIALKALDIGQGDEVITAPNSFIATANAIVQAGAKPVFVDVDDTYLIDPTKIEQAITKKTRAIMPVHLTGRPAEMQYITNIASKNGLSIVEDAAQAIGAEYHNKYAGTWGDIGCFSLHPLKTLNAMGDGGLILTNREELYKKIMMLRNHGLKNRDETELVGYNSRLDEIQATILNIKVNYLETANITRRRIATLYRNGLSDLVKVPSEWVHETQVYHTFIIQSDKRNELKGFLEGRGIETKIHYPIPIHLQESMKDLGYKEGDFPVAERQADRILSLPIHQDLEPREVDEVVKSIREFYKN